MPILYESNKEDYIEVDESVIEEGLANGIIKVEHITFPKKYHRPYKSKETIADELRAKGIEVIVHNGVLCKHIYNTYEAINEQSEIKDYDIYVKVE